MSVSDTAEVTFPPGRYGRRREPRRGSRFRSKLLVGAAATAVVAGGVAIAVKMYQQYGDPAYTAEVVAYDTEDTSVEITFRVIVPEGETATCHLRARSRDGAEVGSADVPVPWAEGSESVTMTYTLPTSARPVNGEVQRCYEAH